MAFSMDAINIVTLVIAKPSKKKEMFGIRMKKHRMQKKAERVWLPPLWGQQSIP